MAAPNNKLFPQTEDAKGALPAWFEQHQPRMADSIPSAPGFSGISSPSLSESSGHVQPTVAPDTSRSAATSTIGSSAPKGTGGSGFVGFEQYFGANQPSAQRMAQQQAQGISAGIKEQANKRAAGGSSSDYAQAAGTARSGAQSGFKDFAGGDMTNAQPQQAGSAGSFNAMLGGRANKAATAEEQKGLNALANYFGQQQEKQAMREGVIRESNDRRLQQQQQESAYQDWYANLPQQFKENYTDAELRAQFAADSSSVSPTLSSKGFV